ncbi:unnamed protein product [Calypogeia fissa]
MAGESSSKSARSSGWFGGGRLTVHLALLTVQIGYGGYYVLSKAALGNGVDKIIFAVYRDSIGLLFLAPLAFFSERELRARLVFKWPVAFMIVGLGLLGIYLQQVLFLAGLAYTNASFTAAMQNAIPVWTFLIAVICRVEVIRITKIDGIAKLFGIFSCVAGALTMSLYKGIILVGKDPDPSGPLPLPTSGAHYQLQHESTLAGGWPMSTFLKLGIDEWRLGSLCLICNCFCMGAYHNLQVPTLRRFPAPVTVTASSVLVGTIALVTTGVFTVSGSWVLTNPMNLLCVTYAGVVASGVNFTLQTWANHRSGPVLVGTYTPLQTFFSAVLGLIVLNEPLYLGTVIGTILILIGLYVLIWGQSVHRNAQELLDTLPFRAASGNDTKEPLLPPTAQEDLHRQ